MAAKKVKPEEVEEVPAPVEEVPTQVHLLTVENHPTLGQCQRWLMSDGTVQEFWTL